MDVLQRPIIVFRVGARLCALPVESVLETHRPLSCEPLPDTPAWVLGVSQLRGMLTPVVDLGLLLSSLKLDEPRRAIATRTSKGRCVDLLVSDVIGLRARNDFVAGTIPPLLSECSSRLIEELGRLDDALLSVLKTGSLVPEDIWKGASEGQV
ncbi:hypothetical protein PLCT1_01554 [Planctomycetaceae bacterium]|nr:hypothetical protein PLCT1_01554 [Planctomycetaceae bacterium]